MQHLLTAHPDCFIHGQPGGALRLDDLFGFLDAIVDAGNRAETSNAQLAYDVPHYCGSTPKRTTVLFRDFLRRYIISHGEPECFGRVRWGMKWVGVVEPSDVERLESLWPDALWVICLREPFSAAESLANTYLPPTLDTVRWHLEQWVHSVRLADTHGSRVVGFLMDRTASLEPSLRGIAVRTILTHVGLSRSDKVDAFVDAWSVIHKAVPDADRKFRLTDDDRARLLDEVDGLAESADRLGYLDPCPTV
jgi:hypothetical protein